MFCAVCSAEVEPSTAKQFSTLTSRQKVACSLLRTQETGETEVEADEVVCEACFAKVRAFLSGAERTRKAEARNHRASTQAGSSNQSHHPSSQHGPKGSTNTGGSEPTTPTTSPDSNTSGFKKYAVPIGAAVGGVATIVAAPLVVAGLGFGAGGIAAGSMAASMMSSAWTTGVGVGVVSTLQSVGAAGMGAAGIAATGGAGAAAGGLVGKVATLFAGKEDGQVDHTDRNGGQADTDSNGGQGDTERYTNDNNTKSKTSRKDAQ